jgi:6,7-dimethyl-8-ribityllumazine synthase
MGTVKIAERLPGGLRLGIASALPAAEVQVGDSIAVDGCCLTVVEKQEDCFFFDVAEESLRRTTLGRLAPGVSVHLERAVLGSTRMGGHFLQGHVDGVGEILAKRADGDAVWVTFRVPGQLTKYMVEKGSIAIDGISLTLTEVSGSTAAVMLVPHTQRATHLARKGAGEPVNIEVDVLAKYVERQTVGNREAREPRAAASRTRGERERSGPRVLEGHLTIRDGTRFALVASRFNHFIVDRLVEGALDAIERHGGTREDVSIVRVPGAWEIPPIVSLLANRRDADAIIALGAVVRGSTPHFDYVAGELSKGLGSVALQTGVPVGFGVLTTDTIEQAIERAGTKAGNKGWDAAIAAIEMVSLRGVIEGGL